VKKCIQYKVEGSRGRLEDLERGCTVEKDCQARKLNKEDAMDCSRWRKLIKGMFDYQDGCEWVNCFFLVLAHQGSNRQSVIKWLCVCVFFVKR